MAGTHIAATITTTSLMLFAIAGSAVAVEPIKGTPVPMGVVQQVPASGTVPSRRNPVLDIPRRTMDPAALERGKAEARARRVLSVPLGAETEQPGLLATTVVKNKPGITSNGTVTPPDSTGSIGPIYYIEMVNAQVAVYSRNLALFGQIDLNNFVGRPSDGHCDPQIQWDPQANRWFYVALDCDGGATNFLVFGWSKTASPLPLPKSLVIAGNWCRFQLNTGALLDDFPKLGHNNKHFIIGTNVFNSASTFQTARIWAMRKPANGDASCIAPLTFSFGSPASPLMTADGNFAFTPVPANTVDSGFLAYVMAADFPSGGVGSQIMMWHISGIGSAPVLTQVGNVNVPSYSFPANVPQPGTANLLDSSDTRLTQAVAVNDPDVNNRKAVWIQHTIDGPGGRSMIRWYQIFPHRCSGGICPAYTRRQTGLIARLNDFVFNGAVSPTLSGNSAGIQFNRGSATRLPQMLAQTRVGTDPLGKMPGGRVVFGNSTTFDRDFSCSPCRWGDYAALNPDPLNTITLWGSNMLLGPPSGSAPHWTTRNFSINP